MTGRASQMNKATLAASLYAIVLIGIVIILYAFIFPATEWPPYVVWLISWSIATFVIYGVDKGMARLHFLRAPEIVLHAAALVGGFAGGWLGMFVWWHKVRKTLFWVVLSFSTALHAGIIYYRFFMPSS